MESRKTMRVVKISFTAVQKKLRQRESGELRDLFHRSLRACQFFSLSLPPSLVRVGMQPFRTQRVSAKSRVLLACTLEDVDLLSDCCPRIIDSSCRWARSIASSPTHFWHSNPTAHSPSALVVEKKTSLCHLLFSLHVAIVHSAV
jgi:hypothetical protein